MNRVILMGNLGADPETRSTQSGLVIANLRLATNERKKDRDGNWADHTEWHRVVVFGKRAEAASRMLRKGSRVLVEGRIRTNKWQDKEGKDRYTTEITCDDWEFAAPKGGDRSEGGGGDASAGGNGGGGGESYSAGPDEDIPF